MLKRAFKWFGFVVIAKQVFTFRLPLFDIPLLGRDVNTYLYYAFIALSLFSFIWISIGKDYRNKYNWFLLAYLVGSIFVSAPNLNNLNSFLADFTLFVTPIAIYSWYKFCSPSLRECINLFSVVGILMAAFSILISKGILDVGIWAAEGDYVRAAGAISSSAAVGCLVGTLSYLFFNKTKRGRLETLLNVAGFIGSVVTVVFSFSRTRWVLSAVAVVFITLIYLFTSKERKGVYGGFVLFVFVAAFGILMFGSNLLDKAIEQMMARFDLIQYGDHSLIYRQEEMNSQLLSFFGGNFLGVGWGSISSNDMYVHNIFAALVMQGGLLSLFYLLWYFSYFWTIWRYFKNGNNMPVMVISLVLQLALAILGVTNGGFMVSGGYFTFILVVACDEIMKKEMLKQQQKGSKRVYENRHSNLSPSR